MVLPLSPPPLTVSTQPGFDAVPVPTLPPAEATAAAGTVARGESRDALWFVRVVLVTGADLRVQSVRVIVDDHAILRIVLHTIWTDWRLVPLLAAYVPEAAFAAGETEAAATALAGVILASLQYDAAACLTALGMPPGSVPERTPGRQERAALRYNRDTAHAWQWLVTPRPAARPGQRGRQR
jgi:hypothetical protein